MTTEWQNVSVAEMAEVVGGGTPSTKDPDNFGGDIPWLTPADLTGYTFKRIAHGSRNLSAKGLGKTALLPKDAILLSSRAPVGYVAIADNPIVTNQGFRSLVLRKNYYADFVYYLLKANIEYLKANATGTTFPELSGGVLKSLRFYVPSKICTQRKIAAILSAYDDLIENNTRRIQILEEMAQALYREWFVQFRFPGHEKSRMVESEMGLIPEGWQLKQLGEEVVLAYGKALKAEERIPGQYPVYGSSGIVGSHSAVAVAGPGIIVGRKGNVGSVYWSEDGFYPIDTVYYVKTKLPLEYVFFNLQRQNFLNNDAAVPGLNRNQAYSLPFLVPDVHVLEDFAQHIKGNFKLTRNLRNKNLNLRQTRDFLLPKLISGDVDVADLDIAMGEPS